MTNDEKRLAALEHVRAAMALARECIDNEEWLHWQLESVENKLDRMLDALPDDNGAASTGGDTNDA